jgi:hypothetical protein
MRIRLFSILLLFSMCTANAQENELKKVSLGIEVNGGAFGLFNVDDNFTKADPSFGGALVAEGRLAKWFLLGGEYIFLFAKSQLAQEPRLIMSPHIRGRAEFKVHPKWRIDLLAAGGMTIWPENDNEMALSSALTDTRLGWSVRFAGGTSFLINESSSLYLQFGYGAFSSGGNDIWVTHDSMLLGLGYRYSLLSFAPRAK